MTKPINMADKYMFRGEPGDPGGPARVLCIDAPGRFPVKALSHQGYVFDLDEFGVHTSSAMRMFDLIPYEFRVTGPGLYLMENGGTFVVVCTDAPGNCPVVGYERLENSIITGKRTIFGRFADGIESRRRLVERISEPRILGIAKSDGRA